MPAEPSLALGIGGGCSANAGILLVYLCPWGWALHAKAGIAFFEALANNAASSGEASSARIAADGRLRDRGRGLTRSRQRLKVIDKGAEPTHHGRSPRWTR